MTGATQPGRHDNDAGPGRVGWLGGTFDPIHEGHLDVARAARRALALESVRVVPARVPPHRSAPSASADHRWAMVQLAVASEDGLVASDEELQAEGPSYTAHTIDRLAARGVDLRSLHVITGADAFAGILTWYQAERLLTRCHFIVVSRPGHPVGDLPKTLPTLADRMVDADRYTTAATPSIFLVDARTAPVSSTDIRTHVQAGRSLEGLVPAAVATYIDTHGLYRGEA